jgi:hypothetical protein
MNKLLPILLAVVLSGCGFQPASFCHHCSSGNQKFDLKTKSKNGKPLITIYRNGIKKELSLNNKYIEGTNPDGSGGRLEASTYNNTGGITNVTWQSYGGAYSYIIINQYSPDNAVTARLKAECYQVSEKVWAYDK